MRVTKTTCEKLQSGWQKTTEVVEDDSPLAQAVEAKAAEFPGRIIVGIEANGSIEHVGPMEGL